MRVPITQEAMVKALVQALLVPVSEPTLKVATTLLDDVGAFYPGLAAPAAVAGGAAINQQVGILSADLAAIYTKAEETAAAASPVRSVLVSDLSAAIEGYFTGQPDRISAIAAALANHLNPTPPTGAVSPMAVEIYNAAAFNPTHINTLMRLVSADQAYAQNVAANAPAMVQGFRNQIELYLATLRGLFSSTAAPGASPSPFAGLSPMQIRLVQQRVFGSDFLIELEAEYRALLNSAPSTLEKQLQLNAKLQNIQNRIQVQIQRLNDPEFVRKHIAPEVQAVERSTSTPAGAAIATSDGARAVAVLVGAQNQIFRSVMAPAPASANAAAGLGLAAGSPPQRFSYPAPTPPAPRPESIEALLGEAEAMVSALNQAYQRDFASTTEELRFSALIDNNRQKIGEIKKLQTEARQLFNKRLAAVANGDFNVGDFERKIGQIVVRVQQLYGEIERSRKGYFDQQRLSKITLKASEETAKRAEARTSKEWARQLLNGSGAAVRRYVELRKHADEEHAHVLEGWKRYYGFALDIIGKQDSVRRKEVRAQWVEDYNDATIIGKIGMVLLIPLSLLAGTLIAAAQYWSYGLNKVIGAIFASSGERSGVKTSVRILFTALAGLLAAGIIIGLLAIPGVNVVAIAIAAVILLPLLLTGFIALSRRVQDYFEQETVKGPVAATGLGAEPGHEFDAVKLNALLKIVRQMERAMLDDSGALSSDERKELENYRNALKNGEVPVIRELLGKLHPEATDEQLNKKLNELKTAASSRVVVATPPVASPTAAAQAQALSAQALAALLPAPVSPPAAAPAAPQVSPAPAPAAIGASPAPGTPPGNPAVPLPAAAPAPAAVAGAANAAPQVSPAPAPAASGASPAPGAAPGNPAVLPQAGGAVAAVAASPTGTGGGGAASSPRSLSGSTLPEPMPASGFDASSFAANSGGIGTPAGSGDWAALAGKSP